MFTPGCDVNSAERGILFGQMLAVPWASDVWARLSIRAIPAHHLNGSLSSRPEIQRMWNYLTQRVHGAQAEGEMPAFSPQPQIQSFPLWLCRFTSKNSAYGHAMISEKKYSWFLSDVLGYGFINRWNMLQLKPLRSPVGFRSYMQMYCFPKTSYGKPVLYCPLTLCFVPHEIIIFLFYLIISLYFIYF